MHGFRRAGTIASRGRLAQISTFRKWRMHQDHAQAPWPPSSLGPLDNHRIRRNRSGPPRSGSIVVRRDPRPCGSGSGAARLGAEGPCGAAQLPCHRTRAVVVRKPAAGPAAVSVRGRRRGGAVFKGAAHAGLPPRQRGSRRSPLWHANRCLSRWIRVHQSFDPARPRGGSDGFSRHDRRQ